MNRKNIFFGIAVVIGILTASHIFTYAQVPIEPVEPQQRDNQRGNESKSSPAALNIGTYNTDEVYKEHPAQKQLEDTLQSARKQMQRAQEENDQQKMQQIQQEYQNAYQQAVKQVQQDISRVMPEAAKDAGVKVVAMTIVYKDDNVKTTDITPQLVKAIKEDQKDGENSETPDVPQFSSY